MTIYWQDYSRRADLAPIAQVTADLAEVAGPIWERTVITGAFARDLHLHYRFDIAITRKTEDIDFAFAVSDWVDFEDLRQNLIESGYFTNLKGIPHRLRHRQGLLIDIVPFGAIETSERTITWPAPSSSVRSSMMDVFGFQEGLASAHQIRLPGSVSAKLLSYPALVVLKLVCWQDRHYRWPRKDADDLYLLLNSYLKAGQQHRLWEEFAHWTQADEFEFEQAGPRMLGVDAQKILDDDGRKRIIALLTTQMSSVEPGVLPSEMDSSNPDRARRMLAALCHGLADGGEA